MLLSILCLIIISRADAHRVRRIVGGEPALYPPYDDPAVYVRFNGRAARVEGVLDYPHYHFRGLKYAHPPVGADRFLRPREKFLEGMVDATKFAQPCIQPVPGRNYVLGSEDCLALNVFTPDLPKGTEGLPVVIWIHGGGFRYGSASQYGVRHLVSQRLVVVTIQYRLGSLGFLSTGTKHLPGNAALWDMALATQWVRNYIGFFGGNPHRIVVMGHDTGASSALLLTLTKIAKGIPNAVVAMSGTAVSRWAIDNTPANTATNVAEQNGCPTGDPVTMVKCLQKVSPEFIIRGDSQIEFQQLQQRGFVSGLNGRLAAAPVSEGRDDGRSLPGMLEIDPIDSLYKQDNPKISLLTGVTKDETKKAVTGHMKQEIVNQLTRVPDFIRTKLLSELQATPLLGQLQRLSNVTNALLSNGQQLFGNIAQSITPSFDTYLGQSKDVVANLDKISDATADALFNVPAFLTAQLWNAPTFLYSFEHAGGLNKGSCFLQGAPLIGNASDDVHSSIVGHGDELSYLFDPHDLEGKPLEQAPPTEDDLRVREEFTRMIAEFARHGSVSVGGKAVPPFNKGGNFIQLKPKTTVNSNFKFCEMALWTNIGERLKSGYCQFLKGVDSGRVQNVLNNKGGVLKKVFG